MKRPGKPAGRLPAHLAHLKKPDPPTRPERAPAASTPAAPDRLTSLLPDILRSALGSRAQGLLSRSAPLLSLPLADLKAALAPYYRPNSRFDDLVLRKLVGEGYLRPRGGLQKQGPSGEYLLTTRGEHLVGLKRR